MSADDSKPLAPRVGLIESRRYLWNSFRAGLLRIVFAGQGVVAAWCIDGLEPFRNVFIANLVAAVVLQLVIQRRVGKTWVVLAMGVIDVAFVTFLVHLLGSTQTVLSFLYLLIPIVFATTTSRRRVSMSLAMLAATAYVVLLGLEATHVLHYAPALPDAVEPPGAIRFFSGLTVVISIVATTRFVSQLISALREANTRLRDQSQRDELTGLYNRRYLHSRLGSELARVHRGGKLMVLMVDLDGFKRVNDEEGHEAGDKMLQAVAAALLKATRRSDVVARYGGDEFVVLLPDTGPEGCQAVAARVVDHARDVGRATFPAIPVTASVGIAEARVDDDAASLVRRADEGVYSAKRAGGDRAVTA
ncbi:MAG TPA: GGDEF domain-containing protein [Polyangiales bacterium]|jgi:diguanylate cyclase (GGDEF)-like protein|nr:GGDEF domain-containing protein [Polyangiales bacterium]